jgi:serine/threonine-protein kinase HipA
MHIADRDFALEGLLPTQFAKGKVKDQFLTLGQMAGIPDKLLAKILTDLTTHEAEVKTLISQSYLTARFKRNYAQAYQTRLAKLLR